MVLRKRRIQSASPGAFPVADSVVDWRSRTMHEWFSDVVHAWRRLRAAPSFTLFSVVTLALGIGATTAIYSVVYAAILRPPDIREIDRVANFYHADPRRGSGLAFISLSRADFEDYRAVQTSFEFLAAWQGFRLPLAADGSAEWVMGEAVGGEYFAVVGVQPALGRIIQPSDDTPKAARVIVLSDSLWRRRFAGDPSVVGRVVKLGGGTFEVIGVTPPAFRGVSMPNVLPTAAWIPLSALPTSNPDDLTDRERRTVFAKGRLRPGKSMDEARAELQTIAHRLDLAYPIGSQLDWRFRTPPSTSRPWVLLPAAS